VVKQSNQVRNRDTQYIKDIQQSEDHTLSLGQGIALS